MKTWNSQHTNDGSLPYFSLVISWSPDHEMHVTFRSQKGRPMVKLLARSGDRREQGGLCHENLQQSTYQ